METSNLSLQTQESRMRYASDKNVRILFMNLNRNIEIIRDVLFNFVIIVN